jgi:hypothetical protein
MTRRVLLPTGREYSSMGERQPRRVSIQIQ